MDNIHKNNGLFCCKTCNKNYSSYKSLWNHNKKFHTILYDSNKPIISHDKSIDKPYISQNKSNKSDKYKCQYCNNIYKHFQSRWKHEQKCSNKNNNEKIETLEKENEELKKELEIKDKQFKDAIIEIKKEFVVLLKQNGHIHPENLKQINKKVEKVNNTYGNNNNVNNGQIINNTYVKFGNLDYNKIFSEKEIRNLMGLQYKCIEEFIKKTHFNDAHPEYNNIFITNLRDNIAYIFDGKEFIASDKNDTLNDLIIDHANEINLTLDVHRKKLNDYTIKKIEDMLFKLESEDKFVDENNNKIYNNYKVYKINKIKKDIYNLSDRKKLELLQNIELFEEKYELTEESDNVNSLVI